MPNTLKQLPPISLLENVPAKEVDNDINSIKELILSVIKEKGFEISIEDIKEGPSYTRFYLKTLKKTKYKDIKGIEEDIALAIKSPNGAVSITKPIKNTNTFGIDVPNKHRSIVSLRSILEDPVFKQTPFSLEIPLGITNDGEVKTIDLIKQPHLLVGGAVSGGKSTFLNTLICTLLLRNNTKSVRFILDDTKRVEFFSFTDLPNLLCPVIQDSDKTVKALQWLVEEMGRRYTLFEKEKVKNIEMYNEKAKYDVMPHIVFISDEISDAFCRDPYTVERSIVRLAQMSRAVGIHLVLSAQRPSVEIFTGLIKANIPTRIYFQMIHEVGSRILLESVGAEKLLGKGDLMYRYSDVDPIIRAQAPFVSEKEIENITNYIKKQSEPEYHQDLIDFLNKNE